VKVHAKNPQNMGPLSESMIFGIRLELTEKYGVFG
jgi:hypothetical protein